MPYTSPVTKAELLNPLKPQHLTDINAALADIDDVLMAIDKAQRAGIDLGDSKQVALAAQARLKAIKQVYFPNG